MVNPANPSLRQWVEDPQRRKIVITLTCAGALLALWLVADEYSAVRGQHRQLHRLIGDAKLQVARLDELETRAATQAQVTAELEQRTVPQEQVHQFRNTLSELSRRSGCRVLRLELAEPRIRPWREEDHPTESKPASKKVTETPYQLRSQRVALTLTGPIHSVYEVLGQLKATQKAMHTQSLKLRPTDQQRQEVILEMELLLFDLESRPQPRSA